MCQFCNDEVILDYSKVLDKKVSNLDEEAFEMLDNYIWDNTQIPKQKYLNFSIKEAFNVVKSVFEKLDILISIIEFIFSVMNLSIFYI